MAENRDSGVEVTSEQVTRALQVLVDQKVPGPYYFFDKFRDELVEATEANVQRWLACWDG